MTSYGIGGIHVDEFRAMRGLYLLLGQRVTIIAGQNGTGKSTLLGMLGQPFGLKDAKTIFGKPFSTKFTDIFKMSPEHDEPEHHVYQVLLRDESIAPKYGASIPVKSFKRPASDKNGGR